MLQRPPLAPPSLPRRLLLYIFVVVALFAVLRLGSPNYADQLSGWTPSVTIENLVKGHVHPVDELIAQANHTLTSLLANRVNGVSAAAQAYRARRGRHPPPEFDKWVELAEQSKTLIIEDFFDSIYDDLEPFRSLPAKEIRQRASKWPNIISIRDHVVRINRSPDNAKDKLQWRADMLKELQQYLPDVDIAFSTDNQQPIIVPWEDVNSALKKVEKARPAPPLPPASVPFASYSKLPELRYPTDADKKAWNKLWKSTESYWELGRQACPPGSPARSTRQDPNFSKPPAFSTDMPYKSHHGYVANWTESKSPCIHPELRNLHGSLVSPDIETRHAAFFPLFADSKIQDMNNVILFPAKYSWDMDSKFAKSPPYELPWESKQSRLVWRGPAIGGRHNSRNWKRFHRHRFVAMANGSWVSTVEETAGNTSVKSDPPALFPLPCNESWSLSATKMIPSQLGDWVSNHVDVGFVHFMCNNGGGLSALLKPSKCNYMSPYYKIERDIEMPELSEWKYVAEIDGSGLNSRFLKLLRSNSVPFKATIFSEWHDKRLIPWKHFVPVDNTFADLWGLLEYFLGFSGGSAKDEKKGHDSVGKAIAEQGQDWARKVLRREDMLLYVYRLILEYARLCDDRRENMGYVKDLIT